MDTGASHSHLISMFGNRFNKNIRHRITAMAKMLQVGEGGAGGESGFFFFFFLSLNGSRRDSLRRQRTIIRSEPFRYGGRKFWAEATSTGQG